MAAEIQVMPAVLPCGCRAEKGAIVGLCKLHLAVVVEAIRLDREMREEARPEMSRRV